MEAGASSSLEHDDLTNGSVAHLEISDYDDEKKVDAARDDGTGWESTTKQSLFPGVPDEITISHILTRLPWRNVYILASLGRAWRAALRSREVYEARVRASSTQTLVAIIHDDPALPVRNYGYAISFYDMARDTWHLLPRIPGIRYGIPDGCGCVSLNGKLYIIGGRGEATISPVNFSNEIHEFDPAGPGQWKQRASMITGRSGFACDVKDGKIYVFAGMGAECASEVYDPVQDVWTAIAPMLTNRIQHKVVRVGDLFYAHTGKYFSADAWTDALFAEVYDARTDQWRRVEKFTGNYPVPARLVEAVFVIYGRMVKILDDLLYMYDEPSRSWRAFLPVSWDVLRFRRPAHIQNYNELAAGAIAIKGELLTLVYGLSPANELVLTPLRSAGFWLGNQALTWRKIRSPLHFCQCHGMCAIDL